MKRATLKVLMTLAKSHLKKEGGEKFKIILSELEDSDSAKITEIPHSKSLSKQECKESALEAQTAGKNITI